MNLENIGVAKNGVVWVGFGRCDSGLRGVKSTRTAQRRGADPADWWEPPWTSLPALVGLHQSRRRGGKPGTSTEPR
jgi:hypothetical protein